jgi:hypothetical protein
MIRKTQLRSNVPFQPLTGETAAPKKAESAALEKQALVAAEKVEGFSYTPLQAGTELKSQGGNGAIGFFDAHKQLDAKPSKAEASAAAWTESSQAMVQNAIDVGVSPGHVEGFQAQIEDAVARFAEGDFSPTRFAQLSSAIETMNQFAVFAVDRELGGQLGGGGPIRMNRQTAHNVQVGLERKLTDDDGALSVATAVRVANLVGRGVDYSDNETLAFPDRSRMWQARVTDTMSGPVKSMYAQACEEGNETLGGSLTYVAQTLGIDLS